MKCIRTRRPYNDFTRVLVRNTLGALLGQLGRCSPADDVEFHAILNELRAELTALQQQTWTQAAVLMLPTEPMARYRLGRLMGDEDGNVPTAWEAPPADDDLAIHPRDGEPKCIADQSFDSLVPPSPD
jgi:hypothetical protein